MQNKIEKIEPDFFDNSIFNLVEPNFYNYRIDSGSKRFYARIENGEIRTAPSVTSILSEMKPGFGLMQFYKNKTRQEIDFISRYSALYGTFFHILAGQMLNNQIISCNRQEMKEYLKELCIMEDESFENLQKYMKQEKRDIIKDLISFKKWCIDFDVEPIAIEYPVMTKDYAGTIDLVARIDVPKNYTRKDLESKAFKKLKQLKMNKTQIKKTKKDDLIDILKLKKNTRQIVLIDLKSGQKGFYNTHIMQLYAYQQAWNKENPGLKAKQIYNWGCDTCGLDNIKYNFKNQTDNKDLFKQWKAFVRYIKTIPGFTEIKGYYAIDENLTLNDNLDDIIKYVDPLEEIKELAKEGQF